MPLPPVPGPPRNPPPPSPWAVGLGWPPRPHRIEVRCLGRRLGGPSGLGRICSARGSMSVAPRPRGMWGQTGPGQWPPIGGGCAAMRGTVVPTPGPGMGGRCAGSRCPHLPGLLISGGGIPVTASRLPAACVAASFGAPSGVCRPLGHTHPGRWARPALPAMTCHTASTTRWSDRAGPAAG